MGLSVVIAAQLTACGADSSSKKAVNQFEQEKSVFYVEDKGSFECIAIDKNGKEVKLGEGLEYATYIEDLNSYLISDSDGAVYQVDAEGNREKVGSDVFYGEDMAYDGDTIYFLNSDGDLYKKAADKEKEKIIVNAYEFYLHGDQIVVRDYDDGICIFDEELEKTKIASMVDEFEVSPSGDKFLYTSEGTLYLMDVEKDEKTKICNMEYELMATFLNDDTFLYMEDYDYTSGELRLYEIGGEDRGVASEVVDFVLGEDMIYYITEDDELYCRGYKADGEKTKIADDVYELYSNIENEIVYYDKDENLCKIDNGTEKVRLVQEVISFDATYNNIVALNALEDLYIDDEKVASEVVDFYVNGKDVAYINNLNEVYLIEKGKEPIKVISDAGEYQTIYFNGYQLFENKYSRESAYKIAKDVLDISDISHVDSYGMEYDNCEINGEECYYASIIDTSGVEYDVYIGSTTLDVYDFYDDTYIINLLDLEV